jgi:hypothetical protein
MYPTGTQPGVIWDGLASVKVARIKCNLLISLMLSNMKLCQDPSENPRVGGSIPPLATIKSIGYERIGSRNEGSVPQMCPF